MNRVSGGRSPVMRALRRLPPLETALFVAAVAILSALNVLGAPGDDGTHLDSFSSYDAASGGYRAWYELVEREGVAVSRFERHADFLSADVGALVYSEPLTFDPRQIETTAADVAALERWVRAGGRLLYLGHDDAAAEKHLLGLPLSFDATAKKRRPSRPAIAAALSERGVRRLAWHDPARRWTARKGLHVLVADARGPVVVRYAYGKGAVVATIDETALQNAHIAEADNARFALALVAGARGAVAFDETPHGHLIGEGWWQIVPRGVQIALALALAALLGAVAGAAIRLGPPILPPARRDANSAEFVEAAAALRRRGRAGDDTVRSALHSATRRMTRMLGLPEDAPPRRIAAQLERADLRGAYSRLLELTAKGNLTEREVLRAVALAHFLRKESFAGAHARN